MRPALLAFGAFLLAACSASGPEGAAGPTSGSIEAPEDGQIVFVRDGDLYTVPADGSDVRRLTHDAGAADPDWSPGGSKIAFTSNLGGGVHIFTVTADGKDLEQVTRGDGVEGAPAWSPDGTHLAVDGGQEGEPQGIFLVDLSTGRMRPITANPYPPQGFDGHPSYAPDGTQIAFARVRRESDGSVPRRSAVFVVDVDGSDLERLTPWTTDPGPPKWSPDGASILFNDQESGLGDNDILIVGLDGTVLDRIVDDEHLASYEPSWSPNGGSIVFGGWPVDSDLSFDLYTMKADGSGLRQITGTGSFTAIGDELQPDWWAPA